MNQTTSRSPAKHTGFSAKMLAVIFAAACACAGSRAQRAPAAPAEIPLPPIASRDVRAYAFAWTGAEWALLPRNDARIFDGRSASPKKQLVGTLLIDGHYKVPAVSGAHVILVFRGNLRTFDGLPAGESGIEVTRLDCERDAKSGAFRRTAQLHRQGAASATFGDRREPVNVETHPGKYHVIRVKKNLPAGRYALYVPDRAFEFEVLAGE